MALIVFLTICVLAVSALPLEEPTSRIHGENGWYVPQLGNDLKWMSMEEAEGILEAYETLNTLEITQHLSLNAVSFYLYTKRNPTKGQLIQATQESIDASNFDAANPTRFTIHGWNSNYQDGVNSGVRNAWFLSGDYNMIAVDWARGRSLEYASSVAAASGAGEKIARLVDFLVTEYGMSLQTLEVVGFSLGAHVAGFTAKHVTTGTVQKVVGLDPASPLIRYNKPEKRLSSSDAYYVETIQTSGGTLGFSKPIGRAAFYPNGGKSQPGCGIDLTGGCSHTRAVSYYVESLRMNNFPTIKCPSYQQAQKKDCGSTYSNVKMGAIENEQVAVGNFYVPVNKESPYGLGEPNGNVEDPTTTTEEPTTIEVEKTTTEEPTTIEEERTTTEEPTTIEVEKTTTEEPTTIEVERTTEEPTTIEVERTTEEPTTIEEERTTTQKPTTIEVEKTTSTPSEEVNDSSSAATPPGIVTTPAPEGDKDSGRKTNIYILNLIFVNATINK